MCNFKYFSVRTLLCARNSYIIVCWSTVYKHYVLECIHHPLFLHSNESRLLTYTPAFTEIKAEMTRCHGHSVNKAMAVDVDTDKYYFERILNA